MNKNKIILSTLLLGSLSAVSADMLGAEAGYAMWKPSLSGTIEGGTSGNINMEDDLGFSSSTNSFFWAYVDHPVPLLPNIKIQQTNYTTDASENKSISFLGTAYNVGSKTDFTLDQTDIIAYWRLLDNWVNFDLGINIKNVKGNIKMTSVGITPTDKDFNIAVPMIYAKARFDLPFSGLSVEADMSKVSYSGNSLSDMKAAIVYESSLGLGATLGLRNESLVLDDIDDINADIEISGMYAGLFYHF